MSIPRGKIKTTISATVFKALVAITVAVVSAPQLPDAGGLSDMLNRCQKYSGGRLEILARVYIGDGAFLTIA